ncbi:MAG: 50S ribosomal protein L13 [Microscillaceae bacterium]|nr:50S ribosomal protein L13 [Microscillaceae bacterium]MDW8460674.1 50S ribosomal protein L13 [Cytophagales bacterium]
MEAISYKTVFANSKTVKKEWVLIDASNAIVGRLASQIAKILMGKHKPNYTPNVDCGDNVIVINAGKVRFTGKKWTDKIYLRHTGYPGGHRTRTPRQQAEINVNRILEHAVKGMLPKNRLGRRLFTNLRVYEGAEHPHHEQKPKKIELKY